MYWFIEALLLLFYVTVVHELAHAVVALARSNLAGLGAGIIKKCGVQPVIVVLLKRPDFIVALAPQIIVPLVLYLQFGLNIQYFITGVAVNIIGGLADIHHALIMRKVQKGEKDKDIPFWGAIYWVTERKLVVGWQ